ncbi:MAG: hypothetical protein ABW186_16835 [Rhodanobacteraceae bacterium]
MAQGAEQGEDLRVAVTAASRRIASHRVASSPQPVIPAKAGIHFRACSGAARSKMDSAFAGMTFGNPAKLTALLNRRTSPMPRWIKLPDSRFIDANRVALVSKVETFLRTDEEGNDLGTGYSVNIGTDFPRESQITVVGGKDEVFAVLKQLLGSAPTEAAGLEKDA